MMEEEINGVILREAYKDYHPHINVRRVVAQLLAAAPAERLRGIKTVLLTNSGNLNHNRRRGKAWSRGKKVRLRDCLGLYHHKRKGAEARVEIFVDNILSYWPRPLFYVPLLRDIFIAKPLFHEIGHHVHHAQRPEYKDPEDVADEWKWKLGRRYFRRKYWYCIPLGWIAKTTRRMSRMLKTQKANKTFHRTN